MSWIPGGGGGGRGRGFLALMAKVTVWLVVLLCKTQISNVFIVQGLRIA